MESTSQGVSFPSIPQSPQKSKKGLVLLIVAIVIILAILGFFIFKGSQSPSATPTPLPTIEETQETPAPTGTPEVLDKSKIKIEVQNGTGIAGEAAYLQDQLKALGYSNITVGNASSQDETSTTVTFSKTTSRTVVDEITRKLQDLYKNVEIKTSGSLSTDVLIVTGLRKNATARPVSTPTPISSLSPSPSLSPTPTGSL